ncbi:MAG TPA: proline dehydrogenase family protein [Acidimicrobiia bacterium]|nr:proline dehydrogenase family protein [Acidimicrobiia bacterium]
MAVADWPPIEKMFTSTTPGRALASRFVAGDNLAEAVAVARRLNDDGCLVSLDLLGEEVADRESAGHAVAEYLECLDQIESQGLDGNISIKPTQLGLAFDEELANQALERLGKRAAEIGTTVTIDMEDSRYTEATVRMFERGQAGTQNFGIAIQAYMKRTATDLERLGGLGGHIRLCKGAYVEPSEIAITTKAGVDGAFAVYLTELMMRRDVTPAIATHDEELVALALDLAKDRDESFEFQMLYGVRGDLQSRILEEGHPLRIYLPFGSQWYPYLTRRVAERPANVWFFVKALIGSR